MGLLNMLGFVSKKEFNSLKAEVKEYRKSEHRLRNMDTDCQLVNTVKDNKYNTRYKKSEVIEELITRIKRLEQEVGNLERDLYKEDK